MTLPESWREVRLTDVCEIGSGDGAPQEEQWFCEGGVPFVRVSDLSLAREGNRLTKSRDSLTIEAVEQLRLRKWKKNSLLFPKSGASALLNQRALLGIDTCVVSHLAIIEPTTALDPDYLYWWSTRFDAARVIPDSSYPSIRLQDLGRVKLPLPTLPEQQRIVDVLQQAETLANLRQPRDSQLELMIKAYLDRLVLAIDESEWVQLSSLVETRYGTSVSADAVVGTGTPVLRIPNVMGGEVDTTDMKYVELSSVEVGRLRLTRSDVLIVRSNGNPDYVGRSAPITEDIEKAGMVYASYLIRLHADTNRLLPEYLSSFLNSAFGRAAMRNAIRTTAGQSNLSGDSLTKIRIPLPAISEQRKFAAFWQEVRLLRQLMSQSERLAKQLQAELTISGLSGELTSEWRVIRHQMIAAASLEREKVLRKIGTKVSVHIEVSVPPERKPLQGRAARYTVMNELSDFQGFVFDALREWKGTLLADDMAVLDDFCRLWPIEHERNMHDRVRRSLKQLAGLGLIAKVALPNDRGDFVIGYRMLRPEEETRSRDIARLQRLLSNSQGKTGDRL